MRGVSLNPYDIWNYPSKPYRFTRIDRIEMLARLHQLDPKPATSARVLELGCGTGGNLLPMAEVFPDSRFIGLDLAASQIESGEALRAEAGLNNVELRAMDLCDVDASFGEFDYIIAHGVYSWVPAPVKARLLDVIAERLAPNGVAYISFNVKPGWYHRAATHDMMRWHTRGYPDPREKVKQGRALLDFLAAGAHEDERAWKEILTEEARVARQIPDQVVYFDQLSDVNDACYFHEFAAELPDRGLEYLSDSSFASMMPHGIPDAALAALDRVGPDIIRREQYLDFLKNRQFRTALLVKKGAPISRKLELRKLVDWHVASGARPTTDKPDLDGDTPVSFKFLSSSVRVGKPITKRTLFDLSERYPASRPVGELLASAGDQAGQLVIELFQLHSFYIVEVWPYPDGFTIDPPERPRASPLARAWSKREAQVPNLRHETFVLEDAERRLLPLLDGEHDRAALAAALPGVDVATLLGNLARKALLLDR